MPTLLVSTDDLRAKGVALASAASGQIAELTRIAQAAQPDGIWDGLAAGQYRDTFAKLQGSVQGALEALQSLGEFLPRAADAYDTTNNDILRALGL